MRKLLRTFCAAIMLTAAGSAQAADDTPVNPQITDSVTQADDLGTHGPSGRPWNTDNLVMRHEYRGQDTGRPMDNDPTSAVIDAMPTPVNGQITDSVVPSGPVEDAIVSNVKTPGVYINEEDASQN